MFEQPYLYISDLGSYETKIKLDTEGFVYVQLNAKFVSKKKKDSWQGCITN